MKIIRNGPPWERKQTCVHCQSLLLLEEGDVNYIEETVNPLDEHEVERMYYYFACAKCQTRNRLDAAELPSHIRDVALTEFRRGQIYNLG